MTSTSKYKLDENNVEKYGLKIQLFSFGCVQYKIRIMYCQNVVELKSNIWQYCDTLPDDIYEYIKTSKFQHYSTLVFVIHGYCACFLKRLKRLLRCIRENKCLRYKAKVLIINYEDGCTCNTKRHESYSLQRSLNCGKYDNVVIFQHNSESYAPQYYTFFMLIAESSPLVTIQEVLQPAESKHKVVRTSTRADLYFYSINPALAIIINNYYFTTPPHQIREGSQQDVINLIRELKIAHIPYILIEDCDRDELMEILNYIERKDFQPLKSFLFFLMSHGGDDNVVYTHDGEVNAKHDIVEKIQANKSLKDAETLIVLNSCRGSIDMDYADYSDLQRIQSLPSPDISHLKGNTMVLYSVPRGVQSPRDTEKGCPLIISFCQQFSNIDHTDDIRLVTEKIDRDLQKWNYYEELDRPSEFLINDLEKSKHNIVKFPTNAVSMLDLIQSIAKDFPLKFEQTEKEIDGNNITKRITTKSLFYICGTLNEKKFPQKTNGQWYFAENLDTH